MKDISPDKVASKTSGFGTPCCVAPEVIREQPYDFFFFFLYYLLFNLSYFIDVSHSEKSDMWSAGVILYLMMYLTYPFTGKNWMIIAGSILKGKVKEPPIEMKDKYSSELREILSSLFHDV
jgi:serine/threonine protein kinase